MTENQRVQVIVRGRVQGVGYRYFALQQARLLGLTGWARNESDGSVEVVAEGAGTALTVYVERLQQGPEMARVESVTPTFSAALGNLWQFDTR